MVLDGGFDFEKPTTLSDVGLLVEEKTFHVNKDVRLSFPSQSIKFSISPCIRATSNRSSSAVSGSKARRYSF